jgi:hypothetical protein
MRRTLAALAVVVCALLVAASVPLPVAAHTNHVSADPQRSPDGTVVVEAVFVASDSFLAVQRDDGGNPGAVVGHTAVSGGDGFLTDLTVDIDDATWRDWNGSRTVHLTLRSDDGDGTFEPSEDPVVTSFGSPTTETARVTTAERAVVTAEQFGFQRLTDGSVTVRRATLPATGHLVVENASDGRVLGSASLGAGTHRNVSVPVDVAALGGDTARLTAVLYRDDGDGTFDGDDAPVRAGTERVATVFAVEVVSSAATDGTTTPALVTTPTPSPTAQPTTTDGQPGLGVLAALVALAVVFLVARGRR